MATAHLRTSVEQGERLNHLSKQLREMGRGDLQNKLRRNIRDASKSVVRHIQAEVRSVRVSSTKQGHAKPDRSTGLRERVARATSVSVTQKGVRIHVSPKKVGEYGRVLPKYLDASLPGYERWRHPVFGHDRWVQQRGQPYFGVTIKQHTRDFRAAIDDAMDDVLDELAG